MAGIVGIANHAVPHPPAEQVVDRHAQGLALDVPQCYVNRGNRGRHDALGGEEPAPKHQLPQVLGPHRVLALQHLVEMPNGPFHRQFAAGDASLANARDALVRVDHHK